MAPPFDKPEVRRAVALTLDRKAFIDTLTQGKGDIGGAMLSPPDGVWGLPSEMLKTLPGYDPDVRRIGPKRASSWRSSATGRTTGSRSRCRPAISRPYRDPAVILIDQLKEIYIDGELDPVDTAGLVSQGLAQGFHGRPQSDRQRPR